MTLLETLLSQSSVLLGEGSVYERLRRDPLIEFDEHIAHSGLIYDERSRDLLAAVHRSYLEIGQARGVPMVALADTWRASEERVGRSRFRGRAVNEDNLEFMRELRGSFGDGSPILIVGLTGPRGDGYRPEEAPDAREARRCHEWQVGKLAEGSDLLLAATLPAVAEAEGIACAMAETGTPYALSFVVRPDGTVLDGTPLADAIRRIDDAQTTPPVGFSINCVHPVVFDSALSVLGMSHPELIDRVFWFQANTSAKSPEELDGSEVLESAEPIAYARDLAAVGRKFGIRVLGGCCGSDVRHIGELGRRVVES